MKRTAQSMGVGAAILLSAAVIVKLIGAFFKIPLTNWIGGAGMGYYMTAYSVLNPVYAVSVAGFPAAIARVSSQRGRGTLTFSDGDLLQNALLTFVPIGLGLSILLSVAAPWAARLVGNPTAAPAIRAIAPAVFFCCLTAVFRGSFEGRCDMRPTAVSQCVEALVKLASGLLFVQIYIRCTSDAPAVSLACAALFGVSLSTAAGFLCAASFWRPEKSTSAPRRRTVPARALRRMLLATALPVCLASLVTNLTTVIDLVTVMNCLSEALSRDAGAVFASHAGAGLSEMALSDVPNFLFGSYTALAMTVFHLVPALTAPICTCALPFVCELRSSGKNREARVAVTAVLKAAALLAVPAGIGAAVLGEPILRLLFPHNGQEVAVAAGILRPLGIAAIFAAMACPVNSLLQAVGRPYVPVRLLLCGAVLKFFTNRTLLLLPAVNIDGAAWGTLLCYAVLLVGGLAVLSGEMSHPLQAVTVWICPALGGTLCAAVAFWTLKRLQRAVSLQISLPVSIGLGALAYLFFLLIVKPLTQDEISILTKNVKKTQKR